MPISFKPYRRGAVPDSRDVPPLLQDTDYALHCPQCDFEYVHVKGVRMVEGPYDGRLCAEILLVCENGDATSLIIGNFKGWGYGHWVKETIEHEKYLGVESWDGVVEGWE